MDPAERQRIDPRGQRRTSPMQGRCGKSFLTPSRLASLAGWPLHPARQSRTHSDDQIVIIPRLLNGKSSLMQGSEVPRIARPRWPGAGRAKGQAGENTKRQHAQYRQPSAHTPPDHQPPVTDQCLRRGRSGSGVTAGWLAANPRPRKVRSRYAIRFLGWNRPGRHPRSEAPVQRR